jgi:hypothetical protein
MTSRRVSVLSPREVEGDLIEPGVVDEFEDFIDGEVDQKTSIDGGLPRGEDDGFLLPRWAHDCDEGSFDE